MKVIKLFKQPKFAQELNKYIPIYSLDEFDDSLDKCIAILDIHALFRYCYYRTLIKSRDA